MFRVLIVEDEAWIRQGLVKSIDWKSLHMELAGEAENGATALQLLLTSPVDIILTDMKMPVCDGKTFLQEIELRGLDCEIIVLSEYTDFVYTRQAIHSHVSDYLLKPIDPRHLNAVLEEASKRIKERRLYRISKDPCRNLFQSAISHGSDAEYQRVCEQYAGKLHTGDIVLSAVQLSSTEALQAESFAFMQQLLESAPCQTLMLQDHSEAPIFYLFSIFSGRYTVSQNKLYRKWLKQLFAACQKGNHSIRIGTAREKSSAAQLREAVTEATQALQFIRYGQGAIIHYDFIGSFLPNPLPQSWNETQLVDFLMRCSKPEAETIKQALLQSFSQLELGFLPVLRSALIDFTLTLERCSSRAGYTVNISSILGENYMDRIGRIEWLEDAAQFLDEMLHAVLELVASKHALTTSDIVLEIIHQIETNYMENISLMEISQRYHINYVHLSRRFKEHTGQTFTEYLLQVRMEKAHQLLQDYGYSLRQIAPLVGYSNPYYFITAYKRYFNQETEASL